MSLPVELSLALRYLRPRRQKGFVSLITVFSFLGVTLGVATLIIVMAVMNGFHNQLSQRIIGVNGHINLLPLGASSVTAPKQIVAALESHQILNAQTQAEILSIEPTLEGQALATTGGHTTGVVVRGIESSALINSPHLSNVLNAPSTFFGDTALIGRRLAQRLGLRIGSTFRVISPSSAATAFGSIPTARTLTVIGLFDVGMYEYDTGYIFIPLQTAQRLYRKKGLVDYIDIRLKNAAIAPLMAKKLEAALAGHQIFSADDFGDETSQANQKRELVRLWARPWQERNRAFFAALQTERNVMFLILTLIILVADFNIISSMIMMVKDKGREIAILRALGLTKWGVIRVFMLAGTLIGVVGTLAGFSLGVAFSKNIDAIRTFINTSFDINLFPAEVYYLTNLPADLQWTETLIVVTMAVLLSCLATFWPAWQAGRLDPVEGLRYE